jgi:hypothetical protein
MKPKSRIVIDVHSDAQYDAYLRIKSGLDKATQPVGRKKAKVEVAAFPTQTTTIGKNALYSQLRMDGKHLITQVIDDESIMKGSQGALLSSATHILSVPKILTNDNAYSKSNRQSSQSSQANKQQTKPAHLDLLEQSIWPMTKTEFMQTIWKKKAFAVVPQSAVEKATSLFNENYAKSKPSTISSSSSKSTKNRLQKQSQSDLPSTVQATSVLPERYRDIVVGSMYSLNLEEMIENSASEKYFVWQRSIPSTHDADSAALASNVLSSIEVHDAKSAIACYDAGASLYFRT